MDSHKPIVFLVSLIFFALVNVHGQTLPIVSHSSGGEDDSAQIRTYIVHVRRPEAEGGEFLSDEELEDWHRSYLPNTTLDSGEPRLVYSYREAFSGFAARLTREEVIAMGGMSGFVHAEPEGVAVLATTHTPQTLGLVPGSSMWVDSSEGAGIIIGVVDSGAHATHPSFKDNGMPEIPKTWKVRCEYKRPGLCNKKIISAQAFKGKAKVPPTDKDDGHGTHVAGTAAGNFVYGAEVLGSAKGTAVGMAPKAHLSIYKVCHKKKCSASYNLAGLEAAIRDRVHVISISIFAASNPLKYDEIAIASFAAMKKNILTVACAGNEGPDPSVLGNDAPWILTVGAATTDRRIKATVKLGNNQELDGETGYQPSPFNSTMLPVVLVDCDNGTLDSTVVKGKIVVCFINGSPYPKKAEVVKAAGGAAMILLNTDFQGSTTLAYPFVLPAVHVGIDETLKLLDYSDYQMLTNSTPVAAITFKGTQFGARPSPAVPFFSGRGPSLVNGGILKPDVIAPGVNILAAWPVQVGPNSTKSSASTFSFVSGTSMATPHVSGIVALLKKLHPNWSPAELKSAIMTTAYTLDNSGNSITDEYENKNATRFAMGAGHVNPLEARDPGLVYDAGPSDYIAYLCGLGYKDTEVERVAHEKVQCSTIKSISAEQLNYPSISVSLGTNSNKIVVQRIVKNVGPAESNYTVQIDEPEGVTVDVTPSELQFSSQDQKESFNVTIAVKPTHPSKGEVREGQLSWVSKSHDVRSPIVVTFA